jgi:hypothetical protein
MIKLDCMFAFDFIVLAILIFNKILLGRFEGKRPLATPSVKGGGGVSIKMDLEVIESEGVDWIHLTQDKNQWRAM